MKQFLFFFFSLCISVMVSAQDIIVKKDGSIIQAKVLKINTSDIEYKNYSNQNGPTYIINITDLLSINYENGEKESFVNTSTSSVTQPRLTTDAISNAVSQGVEKSRAGRGKIIAGGCILGLVSLPSLITGIVDLCIGGRAGAYLVPTGAILTGVGWGLVSSGRSDRKDYSTNHVPIKLYEFNVGKKDFALTPSVDLYYNNHSQEKGVGAGLSFNF